MDPKQQQQDKVVFVPTEEIRCIEHVIAKLEQVREEFSKAVISMMPLEKTEDDTELNNV